MDVAVNDRQAVSTETLGEYLRVFGRLEAKYHEGCFVGSPDVVCQWRHG
jgi:hypothetical protein